MRAEQVQAGQVQAGQGRVKAGTKLNQHMLTQ